MKERFQSRKVMALFVAMTMIFSLFASFAPMQVMASVDDIDCVCCDYDVALFVRHGTAGTFTRSDVFKLDVENIVDGELSGFIEMTVPGGPMYIMGLALNDAGWNMQDNDDLDGITAAGAAFGDARITFDSLQINGVPWGLQNAGELTLIAPYSGPQTDPPRSIWDGSANVELWNSWHAPARRLVHDDADLFDHWGGQMLTLPAPLVDVVLHFTITDIDPELCEGLMPGTLTDIESIEYMFEIVDGDTSASNIVFNVVGANWTAPTPLVTIPRPAHGVQPPVTATFPSPVPNLINLGYVEHDDGLITVLELQQITVNDDIVFEFDPVINIATIDGSNALANIWNTAVGQVVAVSEDGSAELRGLPGSVEGGIGGIGLFTGIPDDNGGGDNNNNGDDSFNFQAVLTRYLAASGNNPVGIFEYHYNWGWFGGLTITGAPGSRVLNVAGRADDPWQPSLRIDASSNGLNLQPNSRYVVTVEGDFVAGSSYVEALWLVEDLEDYVEYGDPSRVEIPGGGPFTLSLDIAPSDSPPEILSIRAPGNPGNLGSAASFSISNITVVTVEPPALGVELFNMQTHPGVTAHGGPSNFGGGHFDGWITAHNGGAGATSVGIDPTIITLTGRGGVGQAVRLRPDAAAFTPLQGDHLYKFEYTATASVAGVPTIRVEGGAGVAPFAAASTHTGPAVAAGETFTHYVVMTAAQIAQVVGDETTTPAFAGLSLTFSVGTADLTYTQIRLVRVCAECLSSDECCDECDTTCDPLGGCTECVKLTVVNMDAADFTFPVTVTTAGAITTHLQNTSPTALVMTTMMGATAPPVAVAVTWSAPENFVATAGAENIFSWELTGMPFAAMPAYAGATPAVTTSGAITITNFTPGHIPDVLLSVATPPAPANITLTTPAALQPAVMALLNTAHNTADIVTEQSGTIPVSVTWALYPATATFNLAPDATNTFRWTLQLGEITNPGGVSVTDTITVTNAPAGIDCDTCDDTGEHDGTCCTDCALNYANCGGCAVCCECILPNYCDYCYVPFTGLTSVEMNAPAVYELTTTMTALAIRDHLQATFPNAQVMSTTTPAGFSAPVTWAYPTPFNAAYNAINNFTWTLNAPYAGMQTTPNVSVTGAIQVRNPEADLTGLELRSFTTPAAIIFAPSMPSVTSDNMIAWLNANRGVSNITTSPTAMDVAVPITWSFTGSFNAGLGAGNDFTWTVQIPADLYVPAGMIGTLSGTSEIFNSSDHYDQDVQAAATALEEFLERVASGFYGETVTFEFFTTSGVSIALAGTPADFDDISLTLLSTDYYYNFDTGEMRLNDLRALLSGVIVVGENSIAVPLPDGILINLNRLLLLDRGVCCNDPTCDGTCDWVNCPHEHCDDDCNGNGGCCGADCGDDDCQCGDNNGGTTDNRGRCCSDVNCVNGDTCGWSNLFARCGATSSGDVDDCDWDNCPLCPIRGGGNGGGGHGTVGDVLWALPGIGNTLTAVQLNTIRQWNATGGFNPSAAHLADRAALPGAFHTNLELFGLHPRTTDPAPDPLNE